MIQLKEIGFKRKEWILRGINLTFQKGIVYGVIGKSGAGKTTLLKLIAGFIDKSEGELNYNGQPIIGPAEKLIPGYDDIQLVNQDFGLDPYHTVEENIREKVLSRQKEVQEELINECLLLVELDSLRGRKAIELSGGEQQRLSIARALACEPDFLLLDEPFVHLDQGLRLKILHKIIELNKQLGMGIIIVSHDGSELMGVAETIYHLEKTRIVREASAKEIFYNPKDKEEALLLGEINLINSEGKDRMFRPNEYELVNTKGIELKKIKSIDIGITVYNYFVSMKKEEVVLTSEHPLPDNIFIQIRKRV